MDFPLVWFCGVFFWVCSSVGFPLVLIIRCFNFGCLTCGFSLALVLWCCRIGLHIYMSVSRWFGSVVFSFWFVYLYRFAFGLVMWCVLFRLLTCRFFVGLVM